jgi:L-fuconolactonase
VKIDAHHHFWQLGQFDYSWLDQPQLAPIRRNFLPSDLWPLLQAAGIDQTIVVQTQHNVAENHWALSVADQHDWIAGVVGWLDLASPHCEEQLRECRAHPKFVGIRHVTQDEPDENFIVREAVVRGLQVLERLGVPFDLLFYVEHLRHVPTLAQSLPNLRMVIDHLSKPRIKERLFDDWRRDLHAASRYPNVYCKLSGLITEADWQQWTAADLKPYVQAALDCFGPKRCMFGSDWPVCLLAGSYRQVIEALHEALGPLRSTERETIFGGTAATFYRLQFSERTSAPWQRGRQR